MNEVLFILRKVDDEWMWLNRNEIRTKNKLVSVCLYCPGLSINKTQTRYKT